MADNYLEKRMEDYRAGRLGRPSGRAVATVPRSSSGNGLFVPFPPVRFLIVSPSLSPLALAVAAMARTVGGRVALLSDERRRGSSEAQRLGLRFYPGIPFDRVLDDISGRWGPLDVIFSETSLPDLPCRVIPLRDLGGSVDDMARFYIFMAHPANSFFTIS